MSELKLALVKITDLEVIREFLDLLADALDNGPDSLSELAADNSELVEKVRDVYFRNIQDVESLTIDISDETAELLASRGYTINNQED